MRQDQTDRFAASIVEFSNFLRTREVSAHPGQTITALEAVKTIDPANRQSFASALQSALCSTREEWERFPELFLEFWENRIPDRALPRGNTRDHLREADTAPKPALQYSSSNSETSLRRETATAERYMEQARSSGSRRWISLKCRRMICTHLTSFRYGCCAA